MKHNEQNTSGKSWASMVASPLKSAVKAVRYHAASQKTRDSRKLDGEEVVELGADEFMLVNEEDTREKPNVITSTPQEIEDAIAKLTQKAEGAKMPFPTTSPAIALLTIFTTPHESVIAEKVLESVTVDDLRKYARSAQCVDVLSCKEFGTISLKKALDAGITVEQIINTINDAVDSYVYYRYTSLGEQAIMDESVVRSAAGTACFVLEDKAKRIKPTTSFDLTLCNLTPNEPRAAAGFADKELSRREQSQSSNQGVGL